MASEKAKTQDLSIAEYQSLADLRHQLQRFLQRSNQLALRAGLHPQQHQLMLAVKGMPKGRRTTIGEVAERLQAKHCSVVERIDKLENLGLILRLRDTSDRRFVLLSLTRAGEDLLRNVVASNLAELRTEAPALIEALSQIIRDN